MDDSIHQLKQFALTYIQKRVAAAAIIGGQIGPPRGRL
jgi:hypothetical protein